MPLIGRAFLQKIAECGWDPQAIGGRTLGADPIANSVARESLDHWHRHVDSFAVRKEPKGHGMKQTIEGLLNPVGMSVVIVDDVCTGGGSTADAIEKAKDAGMNVLGAICLVDREQGATQSLAANRCRLESIFKLSELEERYDQLHASTVPAGALFRNSSGKPQVVWERGGWFFQRWHTSIRSLIDDPNTFYGVSESNPSPVLESIALAGIQGIAAIELGDDDQLQAASKNLSSAAQ